MNANDVIVIHVGIQCPECGQNDWKVSLTRTRFKGIMRTRKCKACGTKIVTVENFKQRK